MIYVLHLLRYCWTELATYFRDVMFSTISSLFLDICCRKIFKNWNIISTIYSNFWRHSILINYTFMIKENDHHNLTSKFGLPILFSSFILFYFFFIVSWELVCFHTLVADLIRRLEWCIQVSSSVIILSLGNSYHFEAYISTYNIPEFLFTFLPCTFLVR